MKGVNQISFIICFALLLSCSGGKQGETVSDEAVRYDPYVTDSLAYARWGDPGSPDRDEERYISFLNEFLATDTLPDALRLRAEEHLRIASLNRPGTIANDFAFVDRNGRRNTLHKLPGNKIMLIFYDPECPHCSPILDQLAADPCINAAIADGSHTVVAIYAEGKRNIWDASKADMPANWLVGYDLTGILDNDLYNLPAMPIIYLLDKDKRVLLKDPDYRIFLQPDLTPEG